MCEVWIRASRGTLWRAKRLMATGQRDHRQEDRSGFRLWQISNRSRGPLRIDLKVNVLFWSKMTAAGRMRVNNF